MEVWTLIKKMKHKINAAEMMYWRRWCKTIILNRVRNKEIKRRMQAETTLTKNIEKNSDSTNYIRIQKHSLYKFTQHLSYVKLSLSIRTPREK